MLQLLIFLIVSAGIVAFSAASLRDPRRHGFPRFFAFESILALVLLNVEYWFRDPFSPPQIASWLMLLASLFLVVHGFYLLRAVGKPSGSVENTTVLVRRGAYRYIRHPLYASLLWLAWGAFLKDLSLASTALVLIATVALVFTARVEEAENRSKFGAAYDDYARATRMFIPFLF